MIMSAEDFARANIVIHGLAEEFGKTPDEVRKNFENAYEDIIASADTIKQFQYFTMFPDGNPTAEEIILQLAKEVLSEEKEGLV